MIEKAKTLLEDSSYCENGMADTMRQRAAIYAQLAIAEEIRKLHDLLATHFGFASIEPDDDEIAF